MYILCAPGGVFMSKGEKVLTGFITETASSDSFLKRDIKDRRAEIFGTTGDIKEATIDVLSPHSVTNTDPKQSSNIAQEEPISQNLKLITSRVLIHATGNPAERGLAANIVRYRARLKKKAA